MAPLVASPSPDNDSDVAANAVSSRKRPRGPRCKTGCSTCRYRRVKCDEGKPSCLRCTSTGRKCEGYQPRSPAVDIETKPSSPRSATSEHQQTAKQNVTLFQSPAPTGTVFERRAVSYFRNKTAQALSGYFNCNTWDSLIVYASLTEPSVWHAVAALSTLHEGFSIGGDLHPRNRENQRHQLLGLEQYNKAVHGTYQLLESRTPYNIDMALISCVLFICHELIQYNHHMTIEHFIKGLRVLTTSPESNINKPIAQLFSRLAIQSMFLGDANIRPELLRIPRTLVERPFTSTSDARDGLEKQFLLAYPFIYAAPYRAQPSERIADEYQGLKRWERRLQTFREQNHILLTAKDVAAVELLQIHSQYLSIMLRLAEGRSSESLTPAFEHAIGLVKDFLGGSSIKKSSDATFEEPRPYFEYTFDLGVIGPLFYTAVMCTSSHTQWMAVLLLNHPRIPSREGMWGQEMAVKTAYNIVKIEEDLSRDMASSCSSDGHETEGPVPGSVSQLLPELGPTWKLKQSRDGAEIVKNYSSYGIGKPREWERSLKLIVAARRDKIGRYREEVVTW